MHYAWAVIMLPKSEIKKEINNEGAIKYVIHYTRCFGQGKK